MPALVESETMASEDLKELKKSGNGSSADSHKKSKKTKIDSGSDSEEIKKSKKKDKKRKALSLDDQENGNSDVLEPINLNEDEKIISISSISAEDCVYTAYIRTGSIIKAGTDSNISLTLYDADGYGLRIKNIEAWGGLMGPGYNYFERGNLDIFSGKGPCVNGPICKMNLTSDGTGPHHGWYCNYVEVTVSGAHKQCNQQLFTVDQWLGTDVSPYKLTAVRNNCKKKSESGEQKPLYESESYSIVDVI